MSGRVLYGDPRHRAQHLQNRTVIVLVRFQQQCARLSVVAVFDPDKMHLTLVQDPEKYQRGSDRTQRHHVGDSPVRLLSITEARHVGYLNADRLPPAEYYSEIIRRYGQG